MQSVGGDVLPIGFPAAGLRCARRLNRLSNQIDRQLAKAVPGIATQHSTRISPYRLRTGFHSDQPQHECGRAQRIRRARTRNAP
jgi:hypothetical protein